MQAQDESSKPREEFSAVTRRMELTIESRDGQLETIEFLPVGPDGNQFEVLVGHYYANIFPQRVLVRQPRSVIDLYLVFVLIAATSPAVGHIPFIKADLWRTGTVLLPDLSSPSAATQTVTVDSTSWTATLARSVTPEIVTLAIPIHLRCESVGWVLAEMGSQLIAKVTLSPNQYRPEVETSGS